MEIKDRVNVKQLRKACLKTTQQHRLSSRTSPLITHQHPLPHAGHFLMQATLGQTHQDMARRVQALQRRLGWREARAAVWGSSCISQQKANPLIDGASTCSSPCTPPVRLARVGHGIEAFRRIPPHSLQCSMRSYLVVLPLSPCPFT